LKFGPVVANIPNLVANDHKSHVVVNGMTTFWLISISARQLSSMMMQLAEGTINYLFHGIKGLGIMWSANGMAKLAT
jgi:hypothetical protein